MRNEFSKLFRQFYSGGDADQADGDAQEQINERRQILIFLEQIPDFEFKCRKRRERAEETDYQREPEIFADNDFVRQ